MNIEPSQSTPPVQPNFEATSNTKSNPNDGNGPGWKTKKRSLSDSTTTPLVPIPKKTCIKMTSSVRSAWESGTPHGILQFFKKATEEDRRVYLERSSEEIQQWMEEEKWINDWKKEKKTIINHERERKKKREQRERKKKQEITEGLRSPDGTKKKVCAIVFHTRPNNLTRKSRFAT